MSREVNNRADENRLRTRGRSYCFLICGCFILGMGIAVFLPVPEHFYSLLQQWSLIGYTLLISLVLLWSMTPFGVFFVSVLLGGYGFCLEGMSTQVVGLWNMERSIDRNALAVHLLLLPVVFVLADKGMQVSFGIKDRLGNHSEEFRTAAKAGAVVIILGFLLFLEIRFIL